MSEYKLLLVDTCGSESSIALAQTGEQAATWTALLPARTAASDSMTAVRDLLRQAQWTLRDLSAIAVVNGPGSFTGVRVGVSLGKGLAEAAALPVIAISRLRILRADKTASVLDAGRSEFYFGSEKEEALLTLEQLREHLSPDMTVAFCEPKVGQQLQEFHTIQVSFPHAIDALPYAIAALDKGSTQTAETLDAHYLRRPDAELAMLRARAQ